MVQMSTPTKALIASARRKSRTARELLATRATEDAESLYRRIASSRPGDKLLGLFAETIVHCVGDSHVRVYRHVRSRMSNVALTTTVVRGATAYGILNSMSNSGASQRIEYSVRNTPEGQPVLLQLDDNLGRDAADRRRLHFISGGFESSLWPHSFLERPPSIGPDVEQ